VLNKNIEQEFTCHLDVIIIDNLEQNLEYINKLSNIESVFILTHDRNSISLASENKIVFWYPEDEIFNMDELFSSIKNHIRGTHTCILDKVPTFDICEKINIHEKLFKHKIYENPTVINNSVLMASLIAGWSYSKLIDTMYEKHKEYIYTW